ncbi:uncharacterized protein EDB93DRAFT_820990 [Suillus bovinus]|uniref:uncharacterized protein n=1 Tax=Suillus bovinus TaxID=48563 RepID=UPI001B86D4EC|nr:uncharacterized protein EDB93DRAFT_820990 [Suillus bovinus]KAG2135708.1 hypothetical protein EDB93DRAFT_820990 [Suillus bovinus]
MHLKGEHVCTDTRDWALKRIVGPSTSIRNLGLDLVQWSPYNNFQHPLISKHVEEVTLTGFATQDLDPSSGLEFRDWVVHLRVMLKRIPNLKRLTFWFEGKHEDASSWARLLFLEFYNILSELEHVSCVVAGPEVSTTFDFSSHHFPLPFSQDNRTRGHRAANDVRELMPMPILCCRNEELLCDAYSHWTLHLDRAEMERRKNTRRYRNRPDLE